MQLIKEPGLLQQASPTGALGIPVALGWLLVDGAEAGPGALLRGSGEESSLGPAVALEVASPSLSLPSSSLLSL